MQNNGVLIKHWSKPVRLITMIIQFVVLNLNIQALKMESWLALREIQDRPDMVFRAIGQTFEDDADGLPPLGSGELVLMKIIKQASRHLGRCECK